MSFSGNSLNGISLSRSFFLSLGVSTLLDGATVDGDQYLGEEIDLVLRGDRDWFRTQDIGLLPIYPPRGQLVPLSMVARVEVTTGPEQINHSERSRTISIQVIPPETMPLETALNDIQREIVDPLLQSGQLQSPYAIRLSGSADDLKRTREALSLLRRAMRATATLARTAAWFSLSSSTVLLCLSSR